MQKLKARQLRKNMTHAERILWEKLRQRQIAGVRFRRQVEMGEYIADFVSHEIRLVIEVDGGQHNDLAQMEHDWLRTEWFRNQGYEVIRFWNNQVMGELDVVLESIWDICSGKTPHPNLPPRFAGGRDKKQKAVPSPREAVRKFQHSQAFVPSSREAVRKFQHSQAFVSSSREAVGKFQHSQAFVPSPREAVGKFQNSQAFVPSSREAVRKFQHSQAFVPSPREAWGKVRMGGSEWQNILAGENPQPLKDWLLNKGSFMERLKEHGILDAKINVLEESWQIPWDSECDLLQVQSPALVRVVTIESENKCWMYARTVFTKAILQGEYACLARLRNRPLGSILFKDGTLTRSEFDFLALYNAEIYARRSLFSNEAKSLLLTEVFMPDMMTI